MKINEIQIGEMTVDDIDQVAALEAAIFSPPWSESILEQSLKSNYTLYLTAKIGTELIGYIGLSYIIPEGEIHRIAVKPEYRRMKTAKALMERMIIFSRENGIADITLEVRAGNTAAVTLYQQYGFQVEGRRKEYYKSPNEDALIMWCRGI